MGREGGRRVAAAAVAVTAFAVVGLLPTGSSAAGRGQPAAALAPVQLPAAAVVGQQADVRAEIDHATAAGRFELVVSMATAVTAVNPDGSYTSRSTVGTLEVPEGAEIAGSAVNSLVNQSFEQTFTATGAAIPEASTLINGGSMSAEQQESLQALVDAVSMVGVGFPEDAVEVGTAWTSGGTVGSHGITIDVTYHCSLTTLTGSTYTMAVSYTSAFSNPSAGGMIEATIAGSGTIVGSVTNALQTSATMYQTIDGIQGSAPFHSDTSITLTSTAR